MTDEIQSAITSDKVETDNTNFATVRADQTCEEALIPREDPFRQLSWQVTLEKGSVYDPPEDVGIYGSEVACKYGVQVQGDIFGRDEVTVEYGGASHSTSDAGQIGARIFGSLFSEGDIQVTAPDARLGDWNEMPVAIYGDVVGDFVRFDRPTIVYGSVYAEEAFRTNDRTVVCGDVRSGGLLEVSDLFAFSISATDDIVLGDNVVVANPVVRSEYGSIRIAGPVGLFHPDIYHTVRAEYDIDTIGFWVFDQDVVWANALYESDIRVYGEGTALDRSWRTFGGAGADYYADLRELLTTTTRRTRRDPPDIEEFRYAGITTMDGETTVEGDVVLGDQQKTVEDTDVVDVDQSSTEIDQSNTEIDQSTNVTDSVVNRSDIDGGDDETGGE